MKRTNFLTLSISGLLILLGMEFFGCTPFDAKRVTHLLSWNVQNLFDGVENGGEYPEFSPASGNWNETLFHDRLEKISSIILESVPPFGPDILVLYEIENKNCIEQLHKNYLFKCGYKNRFVTQNPTGVQLAVLTRCKVNSVISHRVCNSNPNNIVLLREILELEIKCPSTTITLFANHWKSKRGGEEESELLRIQSATLLTNRIKTIKTEKEKQLKKMPIIICGDLNEPIDQFEKWDKKRLCAIMPYDENRNHQDNIEKLLGFKEAQQQMATRPQPLLFLKEPSQFETYDDHEQELFYSLWFSLQKFEGSYCYKNVWETIDHIFISKEFFSNRGVSLSSFEVIKNQKLLNSRGEPNRWITYTRGGYSDHLPLLFGFE